MDQLVLRDGRKLDYRVTGPDDGEVLMFFHGTPGAGTERRWLEEPAHERGMRVVTWSRPGYGDSTRQPGRQVVNLVDDAAEVMHALEVEACFVGGASGGGPHALACAARLPGVRAALAVCCVAPHDADGLDFLAGMGQDNIDEFGAAAAGEATLRPFLGQFAEGMSQGTVEGLMASMDSLLPAVDRAVMSDEIGDSLVRSTHEALRTGVDGWLDDDLAFVAPWGFDFDEIDVPVSLWQGSEDLMVPFAHGQWLANRLPTASIHLEDGEGHLSISVGAIGAMYDDILAIAW